MIKDKMLLPDRFRSRLYVFRLQSLLHPDEEIVDPVSAEARRAVDDTVFHVMDKNSIEVFIKGGGFW